MSAETPEEFWYENLDKYRTIEAVNAFPQNLIVKCLSKMNNSFAFTDQELIINISLAFDQFNIKDSYLLFRNFEQFVCHVRMALLRQVIPGCY